MNQKILKAKVLRTDKQLDLALLQVDGEKDLPALALGTVDKVSELAMVVACGFPVGQRLATDKGRYPAISINSGNVTSLRLKEGLPYTSFNSTWSSGTRGIRVARCST